jgi:hypothetical protein
MLATGGVDWGPAASVMVALDLGPVNNNIAGCTALPCVGPAALAVTEDSAASPLPVQGPPANTNALEVATCPDGVLPTDVACVGRVFGEPLVDGQEVLFTTSTGTLTGVGSDLSQQQGDGRIQALGSNSCNAGTIDTAGPNGCGICASSEQSNDLAVHVGKVASGLAATSPNAAGTSKLISSSTSGNFVMSFIATAVAQATYQKILLQQWWLRHQQRTPQ